MRTIHFCDENADKTKRYSLGRIWDITKPQAMFIMRNPSKAGLIENDHTLTRCINFAKAWGFGGVQVGNLYAHREHAILNFDPENVQALKEMAEECDIIVCAWGNNSVDVDLRFLPEHKLVCIDQNQNGSPKNPARILGTRVYKPFKLNTNELDNINK